MRAFQWLCQEINEYYVLIKYKSYWINSRYNITATNLNTMKKRSEIVFEIDSVHYCTARLYCRLTVHFTQILTVLTLNLASGGDFRRYPDSTTSPSSIFVMNLFGFWYLWESFPPYIWSKHSTPKIRFHLKRCNTEVTLGDLGAWGDSLIGWFLTRVRG